MGKRRKNVHIGKCTELKHVTVNPAAASLTSSRQMLQEISHTKSVQVRQTMATLAENYQIRFQIYYHLTCQYVNMIKYE
jgi:hypothetical protein